MKNAIKRIIIAELTKQNPNSKKIYIELIKQYPEYEEEIMKLAKALNVDIKKGE